MLARIAQKFLIATIFVVAGLGGVIDSAFAHHKNPNRAKCRSWRAKHMAEVRISVGVPLCWQRFASCFWIHEADAVVCDKPCGWGKTWSGGWDGSIRENICSRGFSSVKISDYIANSHSQPSSPSSIPLASDRGEWDTVVYDYDQRTVSLKNFRGYFQQKNGAYMEHYVEVILWMPQDDTINGIADTLITQTKTLWSSKLHFYDGTPSWSGNWSAFPPNRYDIQSNSQIKKMTFDSLNLEIEVPFGVNMDDLELIIISHAGINEAAFAEAQLEESDERESEDQLSINVYPNPVSTSNDISLTVSSQQNSSLIIRLFNGDGSLNGTLFQGVISSGTLHTTTIISSTLNVGTYFATFHVGDEVYVKRFIVQ